jgi:hypothetical protein
MAVTVALTVSPSAPASGQTITLTYVVSGNAGTPAGTVTVTGSAKVGSATYPVSGTLTLAGAPAAAEAFAVPTCPGLTFKVSPASPNVFTAVTP